MEVKDFTIKFNRPDEIKIYCFGDIHGGTRHCAEHEVQRTIKKIKDDPFAYWIDMGDKCEFISPSDPRWDVEGIAEWCHQDNIAEDQTAWYCDLVSPIKDKCIGILEGNHEDAIRTHSHIDVQKNICNRLGVTNLGYSCFVRFHFIRSNHNQISHIGFFTHGAGWAITKGSKLNRLQRLMDSFEADIYACGHMHDIITDSKPYLTLDQDNKIKQRVKVGAVTGCYFRTYTQDVRASYGEKKNYPPVTIGSPVFTIVPDRGLLSVSG